MTEPESNGGADRPTAEELARVADVLQRIAEDRGVLALMGDDQRQRLLRYASQVALPDRGSRRRLRKAFHKKNQDQLEEQRASDERLLEQTGIRRQYSVRQLKKAEPPAPFDEQPPKLTSGPELASGAKISSEGAPAAADAPGADAPAATDGPELSMDRCCYTCKARYRKLHHFYDALCPECAELNWTKRHQTYDLTGRYAMVTGGRVKIGYQAALKLLRAGAHVVVTTRFPRDGARRFLEEADAGDWRERLIIQGVDLRHSPSVEALADHLVATLPRLDFLLNNACQTVRRPPGFYAHLMDDERKLAEALPADARPLLESYEELRSHTQPHADALVTTEVDKMTAASIAGITRAAELSQLELVEGDHDKSESLFPTGRYDQDEQQVDLRDVNSWRLRLADVPTVELLEVQLVNAVAPFILNSRLKPLFQRVTSRDKHIVNVSAMEGVFYRAYKTDKHPHTNMAKAALNMMTRTSAQDYAADGIHMNSVDTGWITDEDPAHITERKREELGFSPPLDVVDAAARICDPIFSGLLTGEHGWGKFLKDYQVANW